MHSRPRPNDPRRAEIIKHLKIMAKRKGGQRLVVQDYLHYRDKYVKYRLPALTTLYRLFHSWGDALAAAGVDQVEKIEQSRTPDEDLLAAVKFVAKELETDTLSTHAYDHFRDEHPGPILKTESGKMIPLPSSSVIRKWQRDWATAVERAGLKTSKRAVPRKPAASEIIDGLRKAKGMIDGMLTGQAYMQLIAENEELNLPSLQQILGQYNSWEAALRAADVDQSDAVHKKSLWSADEARRIWQQVSILLDKRWGLPVTEKSYELIREKAGRPMPKWDHLQELLSDRDAFSEEQPAGDEAVQDTAEAA